MPTLSYKDTETNKTELEIIFKLTGLETHGQSTEGWLYYGLILNRNGAELISVSGTVHNNDLVGVESLVERGLAKGEEYEPLEPDFRFRVEDNDDERLVTCMINHGLATDHIYDHAGIGLCLPIKKADCVKFVSELRERRLELTKGLEFKDYEAKDLPA